MSLCALRAAELEESTKEGAHLRLSRVPSQRRGSIRSSFDSQRLKRGSVNRPRNAEVAIFLVPSNSGLCLVAKSSVDCAVIVTKLRKLQLNRAHGCIARGLTRTSITRLVIIVVRGVVVVIVGISRVVIGIIITVVVRIIAVVIIWIIVISVVGIVPGIQAPPEAIEKNKEFIVVKM